jgi:hypothetical protein
MVRCFCSKNCFPPLTPGPMRPVLLEELNSLRDFRWPLKYLRSRERNANRGRKRAVYRIPEATRNEE